LEVAEAEVRRRQEALEEREGAYSQLKTALTTKLEEAHAAVREVGTVVEVPRGVGPKT
jgi:ferritin-like metal-binding protein YciE